MHAEGNRQERGMRGAVQRRLSLQLICATVLVVTGCGLLVAGFVVAPRGEIHNSVLVAFGEAMTFAGALSGIDCKYKNKRYDSDRQEKSDG